ncbi:MAG TPA: MFS transporter [Ktedonobacterales bacterium]
MDAHMDSRAVPATGGRIAAARATLTGLLPLALAQFVCSYAGSNMNVAINSIATDIGTTVHGVQTVITLFTLTMAALMIPGSKLTDIWGRRFCFVTGLTVYGLGALIASFAPNLGVLMFGYSLLEGVGSALLIPPVYILITVNFTNLDIRAKAFGIVSAAAGIGAAAGPLIGGLITSTISWRASFIFQVLLVAAILVLSRRVIDHGIQGAKPRFDLFGAVLSALGLFFVVYGILLSGTYGWFIANQPFSIGGTVIIPQGGISPVWLFVAIGAVFLVWFFIHIRNRERAGKEPLLSTRLFRNRTSNLGLVTQNIQWLIMQGSFFVISVFVQTVRGYSAIQTGLLLTPTTIGLLLTASLAQRMATRRAQPTLIRIGFAATVVGMLLLLLFARADSGFFTYAIPLFLMGMGIGVMLTSSVNVVQGAFPEKDQGEISGLSRSVSNLGSALGTSIAGSILVVAVRPGNQEYALSFFVMLIIACIGLFAAILIPDSQPVAQRSAQPSVQPS